mmetsp:Transcript_13713/g.30316  ORF Transcript_13713/g.30316 Transcript_13713/m.30316 type:complete len:282 (+) Transcript_13713:229-1074(+)
MLLLPHRACRAIWCSFRTDVHRLQHPWSHFRPLHIEGDSIPGHGHPIATGHTEEDVTSRIRHNEAMTAGDRLHLALLILLHESLMTIELHGLGLKLFWVGCPPLNGELDHVTHTWSVLPAIAEVQKDIQAIAVDKTIAPLREEDLDHTICQHRLCRGRWGWRSGGCFGWPFGLLAICCNVQTASSWRSKLIGSFRTPEVWRKPALLVGLEHTVGPTRRFFGFKNSQLLPFFEAQVFGPETGPIKICQRLPPLWKLRKLLLLQQRQCARPKWSHGDDDKKSC